MSETDTNGNTSYGAGALNSSDGTNNTAFGENAAVSTTAADGVYNDGKGNNTAVGVNALVSNVSGDTNTAIGAYSLSQCQGNQSRQNTAVGVNSGQLFSKTTTDVSGITTLGNTFIGFQSGIFYDRVIGNEIKNSTAIGINALVSKSNQIVMGTVQDNTEVNLPGFLDVSNNSFFRNNLEITGNNTIKGTLSVTGTSTLTGNVAIGKNTASSTLDVSGNIQATNMYVTGFNSSDTDTRVLCPRSYVNDLFNSAVSGVVVKPSCSCATTGIITGGFTDNNIFPNPRLTAIDGFPLTLDTIILVKNGVAASMDFSANNIANGIYVYDSSSVLLRANDLLYNSSANQISTLVLYGVTNAKTSFLQMITPATTGITPLDFEPINTIDFNTGPTLILNGSTLDVNPNLYLTTLDVSNNVIIDGSLTLNGKTTSTKTSGAATGDYYSLDVSGNIYSQDLLIQGIKDGDAFIKNTASNKALYLGANNQNYVSIYNDSTLGRMDVSGCLTIKASGSANPEANGLYIYNSTNSTGQDAICTIRVAGSAAGDAFTSYDIDGVFGWSSGIKNSDNSYRISSAWSSLDSAKLTITKEGNVGIGTTTPSQKLDVNGTICSSKLSVGSTSSYSWLTTIAANTAGNVCNSTAGNNGLDDFQSKAPFVIFDAGYVSGTNYGMGLDMGIFRDTGSAYIQVQQSNIGARDILLQPYSRNVVIGSSSATINSGGYKLYVNGSAYATSLYTSGNIHLGTNAGATNQSGETVAIGSLAGNINQREYSVAIGPQAGQTSQGAQSVAIGYSAGNDSQSAYSVAVGLQAGQTSQSNNSVAIGTYAGQKSQGYQSVAIGQYAGNDSQKIYSVAVGTECGQTSQDERAVAIGHVSGQVNQGTQSVAIGYLAGQSNQNFNSVAIGTNAGQTSQGNDSVAIGVNTGVLNQGSASVAIGVNAGQLNQGINSVAIGGSAGYNYTAPYNTMIGCQAGYDGGATRTQTGNTFIGALTSANGDYFFSTAIGYKAQVTASQQMVLGESSVSVCIPGKLGIGTTTPSQKLDVLGATRVFNTDYDVMGLFSPDYGNYLHIGAWNQEGSNSKNIVLNQFGGNVGINTTTPGYSLDVNGNMKLGGTLTTGLGYTGYPIVSTNVGSGYIYRMTVANNTNYIEILLDSGAWAINFYASDIKLKRNIEDTKITDACSSIKQIHFVSFIYKESGKFHEIGVIAQEIETIHPEFVLDVKQPDDTSMKQLNIGEMTIFNMKATQELITRVEVLEKENKLLHSRLDELEAFIKNK